MNHYAQLQVAIDRAMQTLKNIPAGKRIEIISKEDIEGTDEFYDLPTITDYGKYNTFDEFAIIAVSRKGKKVTVHGKDRSGESNKEFKNFDVEGLSPVSLTLIADMVEEKLKK